MKQLSTRTIALIALVAVAVLAIGVFAIQDHTKTPTPGVENGEGQENQGESVEEKGENQDPGYDFSKDLDVSTWKTYESEKVGVRITYPEDWEVVVLENEKAGFALRSPEYSPIPIQSGKFYYDGEIYIDDISNPKNLSIEELFQTFDDLSGVWFSKYDYEEVGVGKWKAVYFPELREIHRENYYVSTNRKLYSFGYKYSESRKNPDVSRILRKIVENFEPLE